VVVALVASACTVEGGAAAERPRRGSTTTGRGTTTGTTEPGGQPLAHWSPCHRSFECATIEVPLDYAHPDGKTIELALIRHPADDPAHRVGALLMNPGGPGGSALDLVQQYPRSGPIGDRFDLVGFDPRGVGESTPLDCHSHLQELYDADPTIDSPADRDEILRVSKAFVDECRTKYADLLPHLGTTDVARDMDRVRQALGERQISYLGFSYGTSIGQEYARLFPTRVRAMVLDGVVDQAPDGLTMAASQAAGFSTALTSYEQHCDQGDGCGFGRPAQQVIDQVEAEVEKAPLAAPEADRAATPGVFSVGMAQALYSEQLWSTLSAALRQAADGDGSGLVELADEYLGREDDGSYDSGFEIYFAVSCLDDPWPKDPQAILDRAAQVGKQYPLFGEAIVGDYVRCALWPTPPQPLRPVPADTKGLPPIVVVSTTHDPATPYENGVAVAKQIPGAVLVTNEGEGHTIVGQGKPCIDDLVAAYLVDLTVPDDGTTCS
jgi:pimeloyl-ACP methyl ester carboxylesterase